MRLRVADPSTGRDADTARATRLGVHRLGMNRSPFHRLAIDRSTVNRIVI